MIAVTDKQQRFTDRQKSLAHRLLISREDLGWEQEDVANKSGVSRSYISKLERGHITNPSIEIVFALAGALDVSVQFLLGLSEDPLVGLHSEEDEQPSVKQDPLVEELLAIYHQLTHAQRLILIDIAKVLIATDSPRIIGKEV